MFLPGHCLPRRDHVDMPGQPLPCPCFQVQFSLEGHLVGRAFCTLAQPQFPVGSQLSYTGSTGQRETLSHRKKGEKDSRIGPCPLAPILVHIGACMHTHFIHDTYTYTLHRCKRKDSQSQSRTWNSPSLWGSHGDCVAVITEQGAAKGLGMFLLKC